MIHIEDYEHEAQKDLVYLQEEMHAFYHSLNDPGKAQIEVFMSDKINLNDLEILQEKARINVCIPESLIAKIDKRIIRNYERKINTLSFQRTS
jgi:hypothetical protein